MPAMLAEVRRLVGGAAVALRDQEENHEPEPGWRR
jgi:hypothetical protein